MSLQLFACHIENAFTTYSFCRNIDIFSCRAYPLLLRATWRPWRFFVIAASGYNFRKIHFKFLIIELEIKKILHLQNKVFMESEVLSCKIVKNWNIFDNLRCNSAFKFLWAQKRRVVRQKMLFLWFAASGRFVFKISFFGLTEYKMFFLFFIPKAESLYNQEFTGKCSAPTTLDFKKSKFIPC